MLNEVNFNLVRNYVKQMGGFDATTPLELVEEMFEQQPTFKLILSAVVYNDNFDEDFKDGYCKGMVQAWYLLNQQCIIDDLEESYNKE